MMYGPHTAHVRLLLDALVDPVVRRSRRCRMDDIDCRPLVANSVYKSVVAANRPEMWDAARMRAAEVAVSSQRHHAAGAALAIVASDLITDSNWSYYTETPLARVVPIVRPGGPLAERCRCNVQVGQWLAAARSADLPAPPSVAGCDHTTPSLPTPATVEVACALVHSWDGPDWVALVETSRRLARDARSLP